MRKLVAYTGLVVARWMDSPTKRRVVFALVLAAVIAITFGLDTYAFSYCCNSWPDWMCSGFGMCL